MGLQWGVCGAGKVLFIDVGAGYWGEASLWKSIELNSYDLYTFL